MYGKTLLVAAAAVALGLSGASSATAVDDSTSVVTVIHNQTGCMLTLQANAASPGQWAVQPQKTVLDTANFQAVSNDEEPGAVGFVSYRTSNCANPANNNRNINFAFSNYPYMANEYHATGTSPNFMTKINGDNVNHAQVEMTVSA